MTRTHALAGAFCLLILISMPVGAQSGNASAVRAGSDAVFTVRPGDLLNISVWPETSLGGAYPVEESGLVFVPILGGLQVSGLTLDQVRKVLRDGFSSAMQAPVVTVIPQFNVSVSGAVGRPGLYRVEPALSVFDVISMAGGLTQEAAEDGVVLLRGDRSIPLAIGVGLGVSSDPNTLKLRSGDRITVRRKRGIPFQAVNFVLQGLVLAVTLVSLSR